MILNLEKYSDIIQETVFRYLDPTSREKVLQSAELLIVEGGQRIPRETEPQSLFILLEGDCITQTPSGIEIDQVRPGRSFELSVLFSKGREWKTLWLVKKHSVVLKANWLTFVQALGANETAYRYLVRMAMAMPIQKLRRDMNSLEFPNAAIQETIAQMNPEDFEAIFSDWSRRAFLTIVAGEIKVFALINGQKILIALFQIGDSCIIDFRSTTFIYETSNQGKAFVIYENQWIKLKCADQLKAFLQVFSVEKRLIPGTPDEIEKTVLLEIPKKNKTKKTKPPETSGYVNESFQDFFRSTRPYMKAMVIQSDSMRSGCAALAIVARFFKTNSPPLTTFEKDYPVHSGAKSLDVLGKVAAGMGFSCQLQQLPNKAALSSTPAPFVVRGVDKFYVVFKVLDDHAMIGDPENGQARWQPIRYFARLVRGKQVLTFTAPPSTYLISNKSPINYFTLIGHHTRQVALFFLSGILAYLITLVTPFLNQYVFDTVLPNAKLHALNTVTLLAIVCIVLGAAFQFIQSDIGSRLSQAVTVRLTSMIQTQIFKLPSPYFQQNGFSGILGRHNTIDSISSYVSQTAVSTALSVVLSMISFWVLWFYHPFFVAIVLCGVPIQIIGLKIYREKIINKQFELNIVTSRELGLYCQHLTHSENLRIVNGQLTAFWLFEKNLFTANVLRAWQSVYKARFSTIPFVCGEFIYIGSLLTAALLFIRGHMTLGKVMAIPMVIRQVTQPIQQIFQMLMAGTQGDIQRLNHFFTESKESRLTAQGYPNDYVQLQGHIRFENVSYRHEKIAGRQTLDSLNFEIQPGEFILVVGPSGCGKSALAVLMSQLVEPESGQIYYDHQPATNFPLRNLRQALGYVEQDGGLFSGSFQHNIAMGRNVTDHSQISNAAKVADIDEFILSCKDGYATDAGSMGSALSEGQKQRLLIARAIYANPSTLILDESTSHLDSISEKRIVHRLHEQFQGKTVVFFTQRIHLAQKANRIFYMENGRIEEMGSHSTLIANKQKYYNFYCTHLALG